MSATTQASQVADQSSDNSVVDVRESHNGPEVARAASNQSEPTLPGSSLSKAFNALARQIELQRLQDDSPLAIGIVGATTGVGTSTVAANLAIALAGQQTTDVLLIDASQRRGSAELLSTTSTPSLSHAITGKLTIQSAIKPHQRPSLNTSRLCKIGSEPSVVVLDQLPSLIQELKADYGVIVFDLPEASELSAGFNLAKHLDGVILVAAANETDMTEISSAHKRLQKHQIHTIGVIVNRA